MLLSTKQDKANSSPTKQSSGRGLLGDGVKSDETCSLIVYGQYHRFCNFEDCIFQKILKKLEEK